MTLRFTPAQAANLGLLPAPPIRRGRKTETGDGHAIDPAYLGIRETGRDGFQSDVMKLARQGGWTCGQDDDADLLGATERGWPDLTLIRRRDRRLIFAELKAENGELRPRQAAVIELLRSLEWPRCTCRGPLTPFGAQEVAGKLHDSGCALVGGAFSGMAPRIQVFVWRPSDMPAIVEALR